MPGVGGAMLHWLDLLLLPADSLTKHVRERGDALGWGRPLAAEAAGLVAAFFGRAVSLQRQRAAEESSRDLPAPTALHFVTNASEKEAPNKVQTESKEGTEGPAEHHDRVAGEQMAARPGQGPHQLSQEEATVLLLCQKAVSVARAAGLTLGAVEELLPVSMQLPLLQLLALVGPHASGETNQPEGEWFPVPGGEADCDVLRWVLRAGMGTGCLPLDPVGPRSVGASSSGHRGVPSTPGAKAAAVSAEESTSMLDVERVAQVLRAPASRLSSITLGIHDWSTLVSAVPAPSGTLGGLSLALPAGAPAAAAQRLRSMVADGQPDRVSRASGALLPTAAFEVAEYYFQQGDVQQALRLFEKCERATSQGIAAGHFIQMDRPKDRGVQAGSSALWIKATDAGRYCPETVSLAKVRGYLAACQALASAQMGSGWDRAAQLSTKGKDPSRQTGGLQQVQAAGTLRMRAAGGHRPGQKDGAPAGTYISPEARSAAAGDGHGQDKEGDGAWQDGGDDGTIESAPKRRKLSSCPWKEAGTAHISADDSRPDPGAGLLRSLELDLAQPKYSSRSDAAGARVVAQGLALVDVALRLGRCAHRKEGSLQCQPAVGAADCVRLGPLLWQLATRCFQQSVTPLLCGEQLTTSPLSGSAQFLSSERQETWQSDALLMLRVESSIAKWSTHSAEERKAGKTGPLLRAQDVTNGQAPIPTAFSLAEDMQPAGARATTSPVSSSPTCNRQANIPSEVGIELAALILLEYGLWHECKELGQDLIVALKEGVPSPVGPRVGKLAARNAVLAYVLGSFMEESSAISRFPVEAVPGMAHRSEHHEIAAGRGVPVGELLEGIWAAWTLGSASPQTSAGRDGQSGTSASSECGDGGVGAGCSVVECHPNGGTLRRLQAFSIRRQKQGASQMQPHMQLPPVPIVGAHSAPQRSPGEPEVLQGPTPYGPAQPLDPPAWHSLPVFSQIFNSCLLSTLAAALVGYLHRVQTSRASSHAFEGLYAFHGPVALAAASSSRATAKKVGSAPPLWGSLLWLFDVDNGGVRTSGQADEDSQSNAPHASEGKEQPAASAESHRPSAAASGRAHGSVPAAMALHGSNEQEHMSSLASALLDGIVRRQTSHYACVGGSVGPCLELVCTQAPRPRLEEAQLPLINGSSEAGASTDMQDLSASRKAQESLSVQKRWVPDPALWLLTAAELKLGRGSHGEALRGYLKAAACNGGFFSDVYPRPSGKLPDHVIPSPWMLDRMLDCLKQCGAAVQGAVLCQMLPSPDIGTALLLLCKSGPIPDLTVSSYFSFLWELVLLEQLAWRYQMLGKTRHAALLAAAMGQPQLNCHNPPSVHSVHVATSVCRFFRVLSHEYGAAFPYRKCSKGVPDII